MEPSDRDTNMRATTLKVLAVEVVAIAALWLLGSYFS
jgi:hypothetical protein